MQKITFKEALEIAYCSKDDKPGQLVGNVGRSQPFTKLIKLLVEGGWFDDKNSAS